MIEINDNEHDKVPSGHHRSTHWAKVRKEHLEKFPNCMVCGSKKKLEVHHIRPFHLHPELELDPENFITLCENKVDGVNCHLLFGHLGNFKSFNVNVRNDAKAWNDKLMSRPKSEVV